MEIGENGQTGKHVAIIAYNSNMGGGVFSVGASVFVRPRHVAVPLVEFSTGTVFAAYGLVMRLSLGLLLSVVNFPPVGFWSPLCEYAL